MRQILIHQDAPPNLVIFTKKNSISELFASLQQFLEFFLL